MPAPPSPRSRLPNPPREFRSASQTLPHESKKYFRAMKPSGKHSAFSLLELLVVMAIIAMLAGLGVTMFRGGSRGDGTREAASISSGFFSLARNEAIMRRVSSVVVVDADTTQPDNYLRRVAVAYQSTNSPTQWVLSTKWTRFPGNVLFNTKLAPAPPTNSLPGAFSNACYVYPFDAKGRTSGIAKFIVSLGSTDGGTFQERNEPNTRYGFMIFPHGHVEFYRDTADIQ